LLQISSCIEAGIKARSRPACSKALALTRSVLNAFEVPTKYHSLTMQDNVRIFINQP
jgi:hypothetical protein